MAFQPRTPRGLDQYVPPPSLKAVVKGTQVASNDGASAGWTEGKQIHLMALANAEAPKVATPAAASANTPSPALVPSSAVPSIKPLNTPASVILERLRARHSAFLSSGGDNQESGSATRAPPAAAPTVSSAMSKSDRLAFLKNAALVASRRVLSGDNSQQHVPVKATATGELTPRSMAKQISTPAIIRKPVVVSLTDESPQSTASVTPAKVCD
jgi:hypothetical protein